MNTDTLGLVAGAAYPESSRARPGNAQEWTMPRKQERHVVPNPDGGWKVEKPNAGRASSTHNTQKQAERRAKEILSNIGGGEVVIHDERGRVRDKDTVRPAIDPNPPKDRRH
jgi:Uncharacterized protein conserved in bacteria (DUF2188)